MTILKRLLKRPFSSADLLNLAAHNIAKPPLPPKMYEAAAGLVGKRGVSLLDYWRDGFSVQLGEVAAQPTWQLQRSKLLRAVLTENGWCDVFACTNGIDSTDAWAHLVADLEFFQAFPKDTWKTVLLQRYIIALLNAACLIELGHKAFALTKLKEIELKLHSEYYREILKLDFSINQMIASLVDEEEDEQALRLADEKDNIINPLIADQYKLLALIAEQIANSEIDLSSLKAKMDAFDARKRELAEVFRQASELADQDGNGGG
ncbi:hypothetical protein [Rhizobium sp. R693]|uniref:hypothetical protein n=1 Tax=Rhizobium sp. R693 TaxID=1764276 RepID=UPI000B5378D1|nr:hypothetical protein [Rhizobium sp. R693]OWV87454.1 hypothetical protein ATY79_29460 [Rhizobium sp. R693]